jgi:serine/threonine-protein kinase RsbT
MLKEGRQDLQEYDVAPPDRSEAVRIRLLSDSDVLEARRKGRELALWIGFPSTEARLIVAAIEELARNILRYALRGEIRVAAVERGAPAGRPDGGSAGVVLECCEAG